MLILFEVVFIVLVFWILWRLGGHRIYTELTRDPKLDLENRILDLEESLAGLSQADGDGTTAYLRDHYESEIRKARLRLERLSKSPT